MVERRSISMHTCVYDIYIRILIMFVGARFH